MQVQHVSLLLLSKGHISHLCKSADCKYFTPRKNKPNIQHPALVNIEPKLAVDVVTVDPACLDAADSHWPICSSH